MLVGHFEGVELAFEHGGFHIMVLAGLHALPDEVETAVEVDELKVGIALAEAVAVAFFEGGTGQDGRFSGLVLLVDEVIEAIQPGSAVFIGKGGPGGHFGDIGRGVVVVGVKEGAVEVIGQKTADCRLAGAGNAHYNIEDGVVTQSAAFKVLENANLVW